MKGFLKNLKNYIDGVFKADFGELLIYFFEILIVAFVPLVLLIPIACIKDIITNLFIVATPDAQKLFSIVNLIFSIINIIAYGFGFVYLFNKRYEDFKKSSKSKDNSKKEVSNSPDDIDLPKIK